MSRSVFEDSSGKLLEFSKMRYKYIGIASVYISFILIVFL